MTRKSDSISRGDDRAPPPRRVIARRLAVSFALVSIVAVAMCGMLIAIIGEVAGLVSNMQTGEVAIRESLVLATAVREQYIHQAHWIIEQDPEHLEHYADWVDRVRDGAGRLMPLVPEAERSITCFGTSWCLRSVAAIGSA